MSDPLTIDPPPTKPPASEPPPLNTATTDVGTANRTGAAILFDVLNDLGVELIFGHTGGAVIPIHVELNKRLRRKEPAPRFIMCRQEPGAGHAAEGYARASGRVGVALATSGPGATNLVTPVADAYKDSVPTLFITGQVPSFAIGTDAFQEVDTVGVTRPVSKHNYLVKEVGDLEWVLREAYALATRGRPGPSPSASMCRSRPPSTPSAPCPSRHLTFLACRVCTAASPPTMHCGMRISFSPSEGASTTESR
jgi:hypothetical protein